MVVRAVGRILWTMETELLVQPVCMYQYIQVLSDIHLCFVWEGGRRRGRKEGRFTATRDLVNKHNNRNIVGCDTCLRKWNKYYALINAFANLFKVN